MSERWTPDSWRTRPVLQVPDYPDAKALADVEAQLATFPPLVRYLKSQGVDPEYPKLLVAAVFFKDLCYFIEGVELMKALREMEGLNHEALHFRVLRWLTQTEPAVPAS